MNPKFNILMHSANFLMVLCWIAWILVFFISVTLLQASFQVRVLAFVVPDPETNSSGYYTQDFVQPIPISSVSKEELNEMFVRHYIEMRYAYVPDKLEVYRRWGPAGVLARFSSPAVYAQFVQSKKLDENFFVEKSEQVPPATVDILSLSLNGNQYEVVFDIYTYAGSGWQKKQKTVYLAFTYSNSRRSFNDNLANPNGFAVINVNEAM